jgi:hypothetical protein
MVVDEVMLWPTMSIHVVFHSPRSGHLNGWRREPRDSHARLQSMPIPSPRIVERLNADFGAAAHAMLTPLERLSIAQQVDAERIQAAVLLAARGNQTLFQDALEHAQEDWRDLLDRTGLADNNWRLTIDARSGENPPV